MTVIVRTGNLVQGLLALCCQGKKTRRIVDLWRTGDTQCNGEERWLSLNDIRFLIFSQIFCFVTAAGEWESGNILD